MSITSLLRISVIIPTLNERDNLPLAIATARSCYEIIVVDGGSQDGTREWIQAQPGLRLVDAPRGRGPQLAAGADVATGDILIFLHADCCLPESAVNCIRAALESESITGGCFQVRFAERFPLSLAVTAWGINRHSRWSNSATGDQAIFVRRTDYIAAGGFPPLPLFEDVRFVESLRRRGRFVVLPDRVTISARRWLTLGIWRTNLLMICLWIGYRLGISPIILKRWFADVRPVPKTKSP